VYIDPPAASGKTSEYALILPKPFRLLRDILSGAPAELGRLDAMHIDFFRLYTIDELPGSGLDLPWRNILFPDGSCKPVLKHAIAALGCMHRVQSKASPASLPGSNDSAEPLELYNKAVGDLRRYIDRAPEVGLVEASETTLLAIVLLFCFEMLCNNHHYATNHLMAAFAVLSETCGQYEQQVQAPGTLVLASSTVTRTDVVVQLFLRLASDWIIWGPSYYSGSESSLQAICKARIPSNFQSVRDASVHLDTLCSKASRHEEILFDKAESIRDLQQEGPNNAGSHECARDCLIIAHSRNLELDDQRAFQTEVHITIAAFTQWRAAFASLLSSQPKSSSVLLLEAQYLRTWILLQTINDFDQTICDSLEEDFRHAIDVVETYLLQKSISTSAADSISCDLRSLSNLGTNLALTICVVIEKCRDSEIRRRGIELLRAFDLGGILNTPCLVAYYQHLVAEEEMRAREMQPTTLLDLKCSDVPQRARFLEALMCSCGSQQEGESLYRRSYGRMVYVTSSGHYGVFESGQSDFPVFRGDLYAA
jgi:hypothetical protein